MLLFLLNAFVSTVFKTELYLLKPEEIFRNVRKLAIFIYS